MKRLTSCLLSVAIMAPGMSAYCSSDTYSGAYLGARAGYSSNLKSCTSDRLSCDREDTGYGIFAGYDFNPHWGLELSYNDIGDSEAKYPDRTLSGELREADLALKLTYPAYSRVRVFGKAGVAHWKAKVSGINPSIEDSGSRPLAGAGLEFSLSRHWTTRLEYQYIDKVGNNAMGYTNPSFVGLALVWNFSPREKPAPRPVPVQATPRQEPPPAPREPAPERRIVVDEQLGGPLFEFDKAEIRNTAAIDPVVDLLQKNPTFQTRIIGHTDSRGSAEYNQSLSEKRADVVSRYLQAKGIAANRISTHGMGENQPVADNETDAGRAKNRRVEFVISGVKTLP